MSRLLQPALVVALLLGTGLFGQWYISRDRPDPPRVERPERPIAVELFDVVRSDFEREYRTLGELLPSLQTTIRAEIGGRIEVIHVPRTGSAVEAGTLLVEIDPASLLLAKEEALSLVASAEQNLKRTVLAESIIARELEVEEERLALLEQESQRLKSLLNKELIRPGDWEAAQERVLVQSRLVASERGRLTLNSQDQKIWNAELRVQKARLARIEHDLKKTKVRAPYRGVIREWVVEKGDAAVLNTALLRLDQLHPLHVEIAVPAGRIHALGVGTPGTVAMPNGAGTESAKVLEIAPMAESSSRTFVVTLELGNPRRTIRAGHFVDVVVDLKSLHDCLVVPNTAVTERGGQLVCFRLEPESGRFRQVAVTVRERSREQLVLNSGLEAGMQIAAESLDLLYDGAKWAEASQ